MSEAGKSEVSGHGSAQEGQEHIISISMVGPTVAETNAGKTFAYQAVAIRRLPDVPITDKDSPYPIFATILPESFTRTIDEDGEKKEVTSPGSRVAAFTSLESDSDSQEWRLRSIHFEEKFFPPLDNEASRNEAVRRAVGIVALSMFPAQPGVAIEIISEKPGHTPQNS